MSSLSAKNLGFIFDSTLSFSRQISSLLRAGHYHIRDLRSIRHILDFIAATTIATSLVHSRLDYCSSLYYGLPIIQIKCLHHIENGIALAVSRTDKHFHITPVLRSLHWLKVNNACNIRSFLLRTIFPHIIGPKYLCRIINITPPPLRQNSFFWSSVHFHSTCFHKAQVYWSFIRQLISQLMNLSNYKSKILCAWHTLLHLQSLILLLPTLLEHFLSSIISFFRALKPTFSLLLTIHNFSAFQIISVAAFP